MNIRAIGFRRSRVLMRMLPLPRHGKRGQARAARVLLLLLPQAGGELVDLG